MEIRLTVSILSIILIEYIIVISGVAKIKCCLVGVLAPVRLIMRHADGDIPKSALNLKTPRIYR